MLTRLLRLFTALTIVLTGATALAGTPDWLRDAARAPLPNYPVDTDAVVLLGERLVTVGPTKLARNGKIPSFRVGTCVRFDPRAVAKWLRRT